MIDPTQPVEPVADETIATMLATFPFGLAVIGSSNALIAVNDAAADLLGLDPHHAAGVSLLDMLADPSEALLLDELLADARSGEVSTRAFQFRTGAVLRGLELRCWSHNTPHGIVVIAQVDVSAAHDQLRQLRALIQNSPRGMARLVGSTTMTDLNDRWTEITGQSVREATGEGWLERIDVDGREEFLDALTESIASHTGVQGRLRVITTGGEYRWVDLTVTPLDQRGASLVSFDDSTADIGAARRAEELSRVLEATKDLVGILTPDGSSFVWVNEALAELLHEGVIGSPVASSLDGSSAELLASVAVPAVESDGSWRGELTLIDRTHSRLPVSTMLVAHLDDSGTTDAISIVARDLSDLRAAQAQLEKSEMRMHALVENSADLLVLVEADGTVKYASPAVERVLGHPSGSLDRIDILELVHPDDLGVAYELAARVIEAPESEGEEVRASAELQIAHGDGSYRHLEVTANNLLNNAAIEGIVLNATDITARVAATAQLEERAYHDDLTGLPNRALLIEQLRDSLRRARERRLLVGLLFLDLDRFNVVNESLGHVAGDQLLREVASRITGVIRPGDVVARLGGDEFAVVISNMIRRGDAVVAARRLRKALTQPIRIGEQTAVITTSIGIAIAEGGEEPQDLLRDADTAMHRAKQKGRDLAVVFDDHLREQAVRRLEVENILRKALNEDALVVHFQPVLDTKTGRLSGAEALVRLRADDGSLVMPGMFIDVAEDSGLISKLGHQVLVKSIRQTAEWTQLAVPGQQPMSIAVNVSARQLSDPDYPNILVGELASAGLDPTQLSLELTESALIDGNPTIEASLQQLHDRGVRIGLDDFGTGFSSLAYLKRFPISFLKIDRSFVDGLGTDENDSAIVRATIALAHGLSLSVVAEGVETEEQLNQLSDLRCDYAQGYLFSKPVDPEQFRTYLGMRWSS